MRTRWLLGMLTVLAVLLLGTAAAFARVSKPITLSFDPEEDEFNRYMTVITLQGAITRPGTLDDLSAAFRIRAVYRDQVEAALHGLNRHRLSFYDYDVFAAPVRRSRESREYQQRSRRDRGGGGGGIGGGGGGASGGGIGPLPPPEDIGPGGGGDPMQAPGAPPGGGGDGGEDGRAGDVDPTFSVDDILVTDLVYVESKSGDVLDVRGLDQLREYSRRSIVPGEVKLDIGHLFEWNHCLRLPDYPVWREDIWFATVPVNVPGLPKPLMCKFIYRVLGFARVGMRPIAIIDTHGLVNFHEYWEDETETEWVKYEALGDFSIAARYMFDYEQGMIFGVGRPPIWDFETMSQFPSLDRRGFFELKYPGLLANLNMRYYTEVTKKPRTKREERLPPEPEPVDRRHVGITFYMQSEAE